jgi:toxin FitB
MILLDTNVVSELMVPPELADKRVLGWVEATPRDSFATTSVNFAESLYGVHKLDEGARKRLLLKTIEQVYRALFADRFFGFNRDAAREYARLAASRRRTGRPMMEHDAQIAAIAIANRLSIATRDADFADCGVTVINPWDYEGP